MVPMVTTNSIRAKFHGLTKKLVLVFFVLLILVVAQTPKTQASVPSSQDKALSFLRNVMQLDMSKYTTTLTEHTQPSAGEEYLTYQLNSFLKSKVDVV